MPTPNPSDPGDCPWAPELPGWLRGDIERGRRLKLEDHLEVCASCCTEAERLGAVLGEVAADPGLPPHADLAPSIVASLPEDAFRTPPAPLRVPAVAAGMAVAGLLLAVIALAGDGETGEVRAASRAPPTVAPACSAAASWLVAQQAPDGSFQVAGEPDVQATTAHALAALAGVPGSDVSVQRAVDQAWRALVRGQTREGRLAVPGTQGDATHALATWALGRMAARWQWPGLGARYLQAVTHLLTLQERDGSFPAPTADARAVTTRRALAALDLARTSRPGSLEGARHAARGWLAARPTPAPPDLTDLLDRQRRSGPLAGSWGGRDSPLRATCENLLALEAAGAGATSARGRARRP